DKSSLLEQLRIDRSAEPAGARSRHGLRTTVLVAIAVLAVLIAAGGVAYWRRARVRAVPVQAVAARRVASSGTGTAVAGSLLDASGYVVALGDATVSAKAIYKVKEMRVQQGEAVKAGQVIARL